jgi:hypothetical protein
MNRWLSRACKRLEANGFVILEDVAFEGQTFAVAARRSRFDLSKFGYSEEFFVFGEFDRLSAKAFRAFSADAFRYAKRHRVNPLPCGLFESVWCFAIAMVEEVGDAALESVRQDEPPKHWGAAEVPVVYDRESGELFYFEGTPLWGAFYHAAHRSLIERLLG